ncbi:hypothetical protein [Cerasicoccus fimbriatus]|uniref:hypothetical protein n=1 Tax=Cerasicoccus fimbriatus TaxID=3014554 RepID=UPI0022B30C46|nr:hypothetical protein [Cerasicoccus sp. TK19100]
MNKRLTSYLRDNRDHIIENWLMESDLPPPTDRSECEGSVPVAFLEGVFDRVLERISGSQPACHCGTANQKVELRQILGVTCACQTNRLRGHVCLELHEAGIRAFGAIMHDSWDAQQEFNDFDRENSLKAINEALAWIFSQEIFRCPHRVGKQDCPFTLN